VRLTIPSRSGPSLSKPNLRRKFSFLGAATKQQSRKFLENSGEMEIPEKIERPSRSEI
jgi:hypothetical protein